ncbi:MAG: magnesium protoporphyrin IX methyltransferase [Burkholderiaceae bacterium]|jgi:magnesium-protoporphyrin O-methyltransferase|nr:magnesium protoporphyrin IX methyltransferase [Burkholderiaceae bacterium]MDO7605116.1 magnesium protoporphyrin IX methyltransferase [Burkholderiaceae bacterium]MDP4697064.1 magnesium protoporphyrin IX methyltransferase [Burkholderiaceae bacterium]MDP4841842.1 magnesium protoporphyrin IX methyltransferase [Burkholderiaceae bacterium]MDP4967539.1 magnesium protoporphyrin IX methyltransferase [Burkholderiaceae bacterium]|tara:strand:- start:2154 stop:2852 length:699 start_codon:yes stop_codon:yes gene_type:complete
MSDMTYEQRRGEIAHYFDRTAVAAWEKLTSDAPVGRIRASVRAGRDQMRATIVSWLGEDLTGKRVLDAGCGTGALAVEAARRGAEVVAIDLSPTLVDLARERIPADVADRVTFKSGDMLGKELGTFDHVVAMDSIIHYQIEDAIDALSQLADRTSGSIIFTFAPRTPLLAAMISIGRLLPKSDRAPWLQPMAEKRIAELMDTHETLEGWTCARTHRVSSGFYKSQAMEWVHA